MDNASDYGSEDSRFDPWLARGYRSMFSGKPRAVLFTNHLRLFYYEEVLIKPVLLFLFNHHTTEKNGGKMGRGGAGRGGAGLENMYKRLGQESCANRLIMSSVPGRVA